MPHMTRDSLTGAAVRRADKETDYKANTKARAHQTGANHLAGAA